MRSAGTRRRNWRAATMVVALYALVLQAVLGGALPAAAAGAEDILCLHQADAPSPDHRRAPAPHAHAECCTAAQAAGGAALPRPDLSTAAWPSGAVVRVAWRPVAEALPRPPPGRIAHPRGPPIA